MLPALQQHATFGQALALLGRPAEALTLRDASGAVAGQALALRRRMPLLGEVAAAVRGPVWATDDPARRAEALAAAPRLLEAEAPCPALAAAGYRQVLTGAHVAELDLALPVRAHLRPKWRGHLRQAERARLRLREERFDGDPSHWLLRAEDRQRRERRYRATPAALACAWARAAPGTARIWSAREGAESVAGMLVLLHPPVATYALGWTGPRGRTASAHHLLLVTLAEALAARGLLRLDLGTLDTEGNPGLAAFKLGSGAAPRALGGSWVRLPGFGWRSAR